MNPRQGLDEQMRHVLIQLAVVSNGSTASYNPAGGHSGNDTGAPSTGDDHPPHLYYARAYGEPFHVCEPRCRHRVAQTDDDRAALVKSAQDDLSNLRRGQTIKTAVLDDDPDEYRAELLRATEGWSPEDIERSRWRMPARLVRRNRIAAGRDAETGKKPDASEQPDPAGDPAARARELADQGMSTRQIAMLLGKHQTQVQRFLGRAA